MLALMSKTTVELKGAGWCRGGEDRIPRTTGRHAQVLSPRCGLTLFCRQVQAPGFQKPQRLHSAMISVNRSKLSLQSLRPRSAMSNLGRESCQPVTDRLCFHRPNRSAEYFDHTGLSNLLIEPDDSVGSVAGKIECSERLDGMLKYYHRAA